MKRFLIALLFVSTLVAQAPKTVKLTWEDTTNPAGTTYSVNRASGLCSGTPTFATIATGLTAKTFTDNTVTPGNYCYVVTATANGIESAPSNAVPPTVPPVPPINLQAQVE